MKQPRTLPGPGLLSADRGYGASPPCHTHSLSLHAGSARCSRATSGHFGFSDL